MSFLESLATYSVVLSEDVLETELIILVKQTNTETCLFTLGASHISMCLQVSVLSLVFIKPLKINLGILQNIDVSQKYCFTFEMDFPNGTCCL